MSESEMMRDRRHACGINALPTSGHEMLAPSRVTSARKDDASPIQGRNGLLATHCSLMWNTHLYSLCLTRMSHRGCYWTRRRREKASRHHQPVLGGRAHFVRSATVRKDRVNESEWAMAVSSCAAGFYLNTQLKSIAMASSSSNAEEDADFYIKALKLIPHPGLETGYLSAHYYSDDQHRVPGVKADTIRDAASNIYFLHQPGTVHVNCCKMPYSTNLSQADAPFGPDTVLFRMVNDELLHFYKGHPLKLYIFPQGNITQDTKPVLRLEQRVSLIFSLDRKR